MYANPLINHQQELRTLIDEFGVTYIGIFGSRARGDHRPDSDYDILIDFNKQSYPSLFEIGDIEEKLEHLLDQKVDLVTKNGMSKYLRPYVKPDLKVIYEES